MFLDYSSQTNIVLSTCKYEYKLLSLTKNKVDILMKEAS